MSTINYQMIIDEYDDPTFKKCVELLYPMLHYRVLAPHDIRKVDLKERILEIMSIGADEKSQEADRTLEKYVQIIKYYLDNYVSCEKGSRAEAYCARARKMIKEIKKSDDATAAAEDIFLVFLGLIREVSPEFDKKNMVQSIDACIKDEDALLLQALKGHPFKLPVSPIVPIIKGVIKQPNQSQSEKDFVYYNNVLLYCRLMQIQNAIFDGGEA